MRKKLCMFLFGLCIVLTSACGNKSESDNSDNNFVSSIKEENTKHKETEESKDNITNKTEKQIDFKELNETVSTDVENTVSSISAEYEKLITEINTYDKYLESTDKIKAFYQQVNEDTRALCIRMREYSISYAQKIMKSDKSNDDKYDDCEELYDCIYDDAGDEIYDEIYDGILDEIYNDFYDGILDDAYDNNASYDEWSDARSNEYDLWSDTRSDVYDLWSDFRSDVYDFWSDIRSELWDDDIEKVEEKIVDFQDDIEKLKSKSAQNDVKKLNSEDVQDDIESLSKEKSEDIKNKDNNTNDEGLVDGMRAEFKEAMDSYEEFFDEYCAFMKKYKESDSSAGMLADYADYIKKYADAMDKLGKINDGELNSAELKYYTEVIGRINQKLLEVST